MRFEPLIMLNAISTFILFITMDKKYKKLSFDYDILHMKYTSMNSCIVDMSKKIKFEMERRSITTDDIIKHMTSVK